MPTCMRYTEIRTAVKSEDFQYYRFIALISANIVPSLDIEGRELASDRRYPNEGQHAITLLLYIYKYLK